MALVRLTYSRLEDRPFHIVIAELLEKYDLALWSAGNKVKGSNWFSVFALQLHSRTTITLLLKCLLLVWRKTLLKLLLWYFANWIWIDNVVLPYYTIPQNVRLMHQTVNTSIETITSKLNSLVKSLLDIFKPSTLSSNKVWFWACNILWLRQ